MYRSRVTIGSKMCRKCGSKNGGSKNLKSQFSAAVPGLKWLNEEKNIFRMPWKHAGRQDYNLEDSKIFMEWAKHSG